jgi:hypothetical protein
MTLESFIRENLKELVNEIIEEVFEKISEERLLFIIGDIWTRDLCISRLMFVMIEVLHGHVGTPLYNKLKCIDKIVYRQPYNSILLNILQKFHHYHFNKYAVGLDMSIDANFRYVHQRPCY